MALDNNTQMQRNNNNSSSSNGNNGNSSEFHQRGKNRPILSSDSIISIKEGNNHVLQRSMSFSPDQKNFSSKMSRGNKLRKSKRIEETQKLFQTTYESKEKQKVAAVKEETLARDTSLRLIEAGGVSKSPFAGTGEKNIFNPNYQGSGARLKKAGSTTSIDLGHVRRGNAFGDL